MAEIQKPRRIQLIRFPAGTQDYLKCAEIFLQTWWVCLKTPNSKNIDRWHAKAPYPCHGAFLREKTTCFGRPFQTSKMSSTVSVSGISATRSHLELEFKLLWLYIELMVISHLLGWNKVVHKPFPQTLKWGVIVYLSTLENIFHKWWWKMVSFTPED